MAQTYQASAVSVGDDAPQTQPQAVRRGVRLFYVAAGINAVLLGLYLFHSATTPVRGVGAELAGVAVQIAASLFLTALTAQRKVWARLALLTLFVVCLPFALMFLMLFLGAPSLLAVPLLVGLVLQAVGLYFLFSKPASSWYRAAR